MFPGRAAACVTQCGGGPGQQGEDRQQLFGVARRQTALRINLAGTFAGQRLHGGIGQPFLTFQRKARVNQPCQGLEPGQSGGRAPPAA